MQFASCFGYSADEVSPMQWYILEVYATAVFTAEYLLRLSVCNVFEEPQRVVGPGQPKHGSAGDRIAGIPFASFNAAQL